MNRYLDVAPEVQEAIKAGKPVVALESTIISHGMPYPQNVETALNVEKIIREGGAVPATIAIIGGRLKAGLTPEEIDYLGKTGAGVTKASRRDLPILVAEKRDGATTVTTTMMIAAMAGIEVFATGGIGGVHRGAETTMDISADLEELAQTPVMVVCAGAKSILDLGLTLEYLETHGVPVIGYQTEELPAFYTRKSGFGVDYRLDTPAQLAEAFHVKRELGLRGGMLVTNPIPEEYSMDADVINKAIDEAVEEAKDQGIHGKATLKVHGVGRADGAVGGELDGAALHEGAGGHDDLTVVPGHGPWFGGHIAVHRRGGLDTLAEGHHALAAAQLHGLDNVVAGLGGGGHHAEAQLFIAGGGKHRTLYGGGRHGGGQEKSLIQLGQQAKIGADLPPKTRGGQAAGAAVDEISPAADVAAGGGQTAAGVFDETAHDHVRTHVGRLPQLGELAVAVVHHADHVRLAPLAEGDELADLVHGEAGAGGVALGALDGNELGLGADGGADAVVVEAAVRQQIHLPVGDAVLFERAGGGTDTDDLLQRVIGAAHRAQQLVAGQ